MERVEREEASRLAPLPAPRFDTACLDHRQASWDGYIEVRGNRYSVQARLCGQPVRIRISLTAELRVLDQDERGGAEDVLTDHRAGWQRQEAHHRRLWVETLSVQRPDLAVYEEVA